MENNLHLIEWLRKIQLSWELDLGGLSRLSHVSPETLEKYLKVTPNDLESLPSIPSGLENAMGLVGVFKRVQAIYPTLEAQNDWLKNPNSVFEGNRPIDVMSMSPDHLLYVSYAVESGIRLG